MFRDFRRKISSFFQAWKPYYETAIDVLIYQIISKPFFAAMLFILRELAYLLIRSTGRVAISSGDFSFIFRSWQGILLLIFSLICLFLYVAFDINTMVIYAADRMKGKEVRLSECIKEGILSIRKFFTVEGIGIILYIAFLSPLVGLGLSISLTSDLYIPTFITSVIEDRFLYHILYFIFILFFAFIGIIHIFAIYGIVAENMNVHEALKESRRLIRKNWKDFIGQHISFLMSILLMNVILLGIFLVAPILIIGHLPVTYHIYRMLVIFVLAGFYVSFFILNLMDIPFYVLWMTRIYLSYHYEEAVFIPRRNNREVYLFEVAAVIVWMGLLLASTYVNDNFDTFFKKDFDGRIIAHRAGGSEAFENSLEGIRKAVQLDIYGSEIDIQRTKDDHYILNHDNDFKRLYNDPHSSIQLELAQIEELTEKVAGVPKIATLEESLDTAKGKIVLFIELKGNSADKRMADDAVKMIREKDMVDECVLISLKYDLITYIESAYPEIKTAYLTFAVFGDVKELNCDYIGLEEEAASREAIRSIHSGNKKVLVWTVNERSSQKHFLLSEADYLITDNISQADVLISSLKMRNDFEIIFDWFLDF